MPRKGPAPRRELQPDPVYRSLLVTQLVNKILQRGKRSTAERIVYDALSTIETKTGTDPIVTLKRAVDNIKPQLEVRSRRVGGATYQVPVEVNPKRRLSLSFRWVLEAARSRAGHSMTEKLAGELMEASENSPKSSSIKKKEDTHKMAEANKAFAHYRW